MTTFTSRRFNQDASGAKRATAQGPVFITDRGRPAHVLMTIEQYRRLQGGKKTIGELLAMEGAGNIEIEFPRSQELPRIVDLD